jgi:hypothetical protein
MEVEIMYNACYGGFSMSKEAVICYLDSNGYVLCPYYISRGLERTDPSMIEIVKQLGARANGKCADIKIQSVPIKYKDYVEVGEYDGYESVYILTNINWGPFKKYCMTQRLHRNWIPFNMCWMSQTIFDTMVYLTFFLVLFMFCLFLTYFTLYFQRIIFYDVAV